MSEHSFDIDIAKEYGIEEAILLKNINYWVEKNEANGKNFYDGYYWTYNSIKAFKEMFPYMSEKKIRNALNKLIENDLIITGCYNSDVRDRTLWYAITEKGKSILPQSKLHSAERANDIVYNNIYSNNTNINNTNIIPNSNKENNISKDIFKESPMKTNEKRKYGDNQRVVLTDDEYLNLVKDYGKDYVDAMIIKLDEYVAMNNNKNGYKNFNLVMRKALKEQWFKLNPNNFIKPVNANLDLDSEADTINDNIPSIEIRANTYFTNLYNTDRNRYYTEIENLKQKNPSLAKYVVNKVENGGFEEL